MYIYIYTHTHVTLVIPELLHDLHAQVYNFICNYPLSSLMFMNHQQSIIDLYSCIVLNKLSLPPQFVVLVSRLERSHLASSSHLYRKKYFSGGPTCNKNIQTLLRKDVQFTLKMVNIFCYCSTDLRVFLLISFIIHPD